MAGPPSAPDDGVATDGVPSEFGNLAIIERLESCVARDGRNDGLRATE
jgi:hypothetical protein